MKNDPTVNQIKTLCEELGHGHLMTLISALWIEKLESKGHSSSGAFVPALPFQITDQEKASVLNEVKYYKRYIK